jgi:hypothetical protein
MPDQISHIRRRLTEKERATIHIEESLQVIASRQREPDLWERVCLVQAIGALFRGAYGLASVEAALALTPESERSRKPYLPPEAEFARFDMATLRRGFDEARTQEVLDFPAFEPIAFRAV